MKPAVFVLVFFCAPLFAQDSVSDRLSREIAQVTGAAERVVPEEQRGPAMQRLARAKAAVDAGRLHLALYELEGAYVMTNAFAFANDNAAITSADDLAARWKAVGEPKPAGATSAASPALLQAFAGSAAARAPVTYRASLPYGQDAGVPAGLYYLGEARALAAFANFVRSLKWDRSGAVPDIRSILPELNAFESEVTTAYTRMTPADHPTYIVTSVLLKRARALNDAGEHAGALVEYLLARLRFAPLRGPVADPQVNTQLIADARKQLSAGVDHSIANLFLEMAEASANASTILADVLPAYRAATSPVASTTTATAADPAVTITLVRWPFT